MWLLRAKSPVQIQKTSFSHFSSPSFKDVESLCFSDDAHTDSKHQCPLPPPSKKSSSFVFHRVRLASSFLRALKSHSEPRHFSDVSLSPSSPDNTDSTSAEADQSELSISLPGTEKQIVVYYTSLHVIRSTFEDCKDVRSILRSFRVPVDERDLSMDSCFMEELQKIMGQIEKSKMSLPRVFIGGRYIGGAEEIRQLNETGELKKFVEGLPRAEPGTCELCGGYRFILCDECCGSHKCYSEKFGFRSCTACNENGLIRCPSCYCSPL